MAQSTLLSSQVQNRKGFVVSVERTIRLAEFESLRVALSESFPEGMDHDQAYKLIHEQVEEWATAAKPSNSVNENRAPAHDFKPKESLTVLENHAKESPRVSDNHALPPGPAASKPPSVTVETLRERLAKWLDKVEVTSTLNGFAVKPRHFLLRETWQAIDDALRTIGAKWIPQAKGVGSWQVPA